MPSHIYARLGDHLASARCNEAAVKADEKFLKETSERGVYRVMYYSHNLYFLTFASCMDGDFQEAKDAAAKLVRNVTPAVKEDPMFENFLLSPIMVLLAFERWQDILKLPRPESSLALTNAAWHSARGIAFANLGQTTEAENEQGAFHDAISKISPEESYDMLNTRAAVLKVHENVLASAIAQSHRNDNAAIDLLKKAIVAEDALNYSEPPPAWYPPLRPALGRLLLATNQSAEAERVFRADLSRNPRDARGLAGLRDCLRAQGRTYEAEQIDQQFYGTWKRTGSSSLQL
ncbi:MAG: tetratricopeptide repeat protein, partial [Chthoniobacterales bacterium]